jgi:hypothetical protein
MQQLEAKGYKPIVAEGRRTIEQQREKVKLGYSQTLKSYHLTGLAADIVDSELLWNIPLYHKYWYDLGNIVKEMKIKEGYLIWGGVWSKPERWAKIEQAQKNQSSKGLDWFFDGAHVEMRI